MFKKGYIPWNKGKNGYKIKSTNSGKDHWRWKGGRRLNSGGYILVMAKDHPRAWGWGYYLEHRMVVEKRIGRYLKPDEMVHHINGVKHDNRIENLQIIPRKSRGFPKNAECPKCHYRFIVR